ncbi:hypothetical protein Tco_0975767 [Tanacetum coccineum]|uniref:Uncharacterized protein n=1 Tax=Tanacetum coccineum TaxID=301880 RepID=A0ABQ5EFE8_9ASTR
MSVCRGKIGIILESRKEAEAVIGSLKEHVVDPYLAMVQEASTAAPLKSKIAHILPQRSRQHKGMPPLLR